MLKRQKVVRGFLSLQKQGDHMHSGCPGCRQTGEMVVMTGCFGSEDYWHKATCEAAAHLILQPQYTDNPLNICES